MSHHITFQALRHISTECAVPSSIYGNEMLQLENNLETTETKSRLKH
jgi:hypothetical protein